MQRKTFLTRVGAITLDCEVLATTDGQTLVILAPPPGSSALEKLRLLAVVGDQTVGSGVAQPRTFSTSSARGPADAGFWPV